jgi:hypothetical protein
MKVNIDAKESLQRDPAHDIQSVLNIGFKCPDTRTAINKVVARLEGRIWAHENDEQQMCEDEYEDCKNDLALLKLLIG